MRTEFNLPFVLNVVGIFLAFSVLTGLYIWPSFRKLPRDEALKILALVHAFRFLGLSFLVAGVVSPELTLLFARPAAWGDFGSAVLALLSYCSADMALVNRHPAHLAVQHMGLDRSSLRELSGLYTSY
jgi:hypothetical protein